MGWIKLDRRIMKNFLWNDGEPFDKRSAWIDLLLMANHADHEVIYRGKLVVFKRGEVNRSILQLAERWHWSRGKVTRYLTALENAKMCAVNSTTDGTTITIENYSKFQDSRATNSTTDDTTDDTTDGQRTVQRTDTYKNYKEYINNNIYKESQKEYKKGQYDSAMSEKSLARLNAFRQKRDEVNERWRKEKPELWDESQGPIQQ